MIAVAAFLLGLLALLQALGPVTQTVAVILSAAAMILAILALAGIAPGPRLTPWRRQP